MAMPRKNPPINALADIEQLALKGHSTIGLAKHFGVSRSVIARWFEENEKFEEAYEQGRDAYRQALEEQIIAMTLAGKIPTGLIYLLKAKFKMYDQPGSSVKVDVPITTVQSVMVVKDHGTDEEWAAQAARQQRKLLEDAHQPIIEAAREPAALPASLPPPNMPAPAPAAPTAPAWQPPAIPYAPPSWRS